MNRVNTAVQLHLGGVGEEEKESPRQEKKSSRWNREKPTDSLGKSFNDLRRFRSGGVAGGSASSGTEATCEKE